MKRTMTRIGTAIVFLIPAGAQSQTPAPAGRPPAHTRLLEADSITTFVVTLKNGSVFAGRVRTVRNDSLVFASNARLLTLSLSDIRKATAVREQDLRDGEYWFPNANKTRLMFSPTGRMLDKGDGYFSTFMLFIPGVSYGITDFVGVGGGMLFQPFERVDEQTLYLTSKVGVIRSEWLNVAAGGLLVKAPRGDSERFGVLYGVGTLGSENTSITAGVGYGYSGSDLVGESPLVIIGGEHRASPRFGLVSDNILFPGEVLQGLSIMGFRFFGEDMSLDAGALWILGRGSSHVPVLPYIGLVLNF